MENGAGVETGPALSFGPEQFSADSVIFSRRPLPGAIFKDVSLLWYARPPMSNLLYRIDEQALWIRGAFFRMAGHVTPNYGHASRNTIKAHPGVKR